MVEFDGTNGAVLLKKAMQHLILYVGSNKFELINRAFSNCFSKDIALLRCFPKRLSGMNVCTLNKKRSHKHGELEKNQKDNIGSFVYQCVEVIVLKP